MTQVVSSISGIQVYSPSAGFAPTNSADVSAIASGYQVVSATATQLYAGTAYLTSVNDAPVSASRAGNAANASMANSAYYDGTGRLISSLPDEATVSSIASSYAESAASGKLDTTAQVVTSTSSASGLYYDYSGNLSSYTAINALNGSALSAIASLSAEMAVVSTHTRHATSAEVASFDENYRALTAMAMSSDVSGVIDTVSANSASWGQGGVDSATVSAIASAYVESGVSGKLDTTAFNSSDFYGTGNESGFVDSGYVDSAVSGKQDSSAMTAYQLSGDYAYNSSLSGYIPTSESSKYVTSLAGYATEEYVDSSVSGKLDATAQVVSSTAGDGTYVTAINGMGISGQGGGGGAGIDSSTCSAIASAYAESAASSKLDITAYNSGDFYTTSNESGYVDSAYVERRISGKQNSGNYISAKGIDQSITNAAGTRAIAFGAIGKPGIFLTGEFGTAYYKDNELNLNRNGMKIAFNIGGAGPQISAMGNNARMHLFVSGGSSGTYGIYGFSSTTSAGQTITKYGPGEYGQLTSVYDTVSANSAAWGGGATGDYVEKSATEVAIGSFNTVSTTAFAQGFGNKASYKSFAQGFGNTASDYSFAQGFDNTVSSYSFAQGQYNIATNTAAVFGQYNLRGDGDTSTGNSAAFAIGDGTSEGARHDLMLVTKDGEITMYSSTADTVGTGIMSSIRAISAAATGGVDSATVSAIASSYAESAASSKMDSSAIDYTRTGDGTQIFASGTGSSTNQFSAKNDSAGAAIIAGENARLRLWDTAATANLYASSIGGWNAASNLVSSQSANWGGSALALSAGPGVKLEKVGDTLVASTDETLLWSGNTEVTSFPTIESPYNFKRLRFVQLPVGSFAASDAEATIPSSATAVSVMHTIASTGNWGIANTNYSINSSGLSVIGGMHLKYSAYNSVGISYLTGVPPRIGEIYGINRTAEA